MKKAIFTFLAISSMNVYALGIDPNHIRSMTYGQCKADPTVRFVASVYKEKYPSTSLNQILHILCKDAR